MTTPRCIKPNKIIIQSDNFGLYLSIQKIKKQVDEFIENEFEDLQNQPSTN